MDDMERLAEQAKRNGESRDCWEQFADHRDRVTQLILQSPSKQSLCILGAGNGNDFDLELLCNHFERLLLVDYDRVSLEYAIERLPKGDRQRIELLHGLDLRTQKLPSELEAFDVTCSIGLVSQLIEQTVLCEQDNGSQRLEESLDQTRCHHMQTINDVTRAGGQALMVWEVVSSVTCPEIVAAELSDLPNVLHTALNSRNFFTGLNPAKVLESFRAVKGASCKVQVHAPWKWDFLDRVYAVTAISFRVE